MTDVDALRSSVGVLVPDDGPHTLQSLARSVTVLFEGLFSELEQMRQALVPLFAEGPVSSDAVLEVVRPRTQALLEGGVTLGAGYVAARDALEDKGLYLAWWQGTTQQLLGDPDGLASNAPFDYTRLEWFTVPQATGRRHITGPYVDFVCTDEYVVTSTVPVVVDDRTVGVVGTDTLVETLEQLLLPALSAAEATLVSNRDRVLVSADHRLAPGRPVDLSGHAERIDCDGLPLAVVGPR